LVSEQKAEATAKHVRRAAIEAHLQNNLGIAEPLYQQLLDGPHQQSSDWANLGALLRSQGRLDEAIALYEKALKICSLDTELCLNASNTFRDGGLLETSEHILRQGLVNDPESFPLKHSLAKTWISASRNLEACKLLKKLTLEDSKNQDLWTDLGIAEAHLGQPKLALNAFREALNIDPNHLLTRANCITLLADQRLIEDAQSVFNDTPTEQRQAKEMRTAKANLLMARQDMVEASETLYQLCLEEPESAQHWLNLSACLRSLKQNVLPTMVTKLGLSLHPDHFDLKNSLLQALAESGQIAAARRLLEQINTDEISDKSNRLFNLQFLAVSCDLLDPQKRQKLAREWEKKHCSKMTSPLWKDYFIDSLSRRRLRIGYLSSDFCSHPVSRFLLPVLANHDRQAVEIWGLHTGPHWDIVSESIRQQCNHWLDLTKCSDLQAARMIADQRLDVVVELGGFTGNSRIGICLHEPAPIQMSYLGYPAATHLKSVPWWIGDNTLFGTLEEIELEQARVEINGGYMCMPFLAQNVLEEDATGRSTFRFGSFNHARKLTDSTIELWCELLEKTPDAEIIIKSISFLEVAEMERIRSRFINRGIHKNRLIMLAWEKDFGAHLAQYNKIDVALDPIPYGGATTTAESLSMGIPVVCLQGKGMVGSLTASLLASAGLKNLISHSEEQYVAKAVSFYQQGHRSTQDRQSMAAAVMDSPLNNARRVSKGLESCYRKCLAQLPEMQFIQ